jgi:preprotein translocase subunit SecA
VVAGGGSDLTKAAYSSDVGITDRLKKSFRQLLQRPGATVSLAPYEALLGDIEDREAELREWSDAELTAAALAMLPVSRSTTRDATDESDVIDDTSEAGESDADESGLAGPDVDETSDSADVIGAEFGAVAVELTTDEIIEVCALGREAGRRALGERAFDVQLFGAMAMLDRRIAEMATGEGKTLAAVIAAFGHVVRGSRVHVLTVNDYLARRDATWMGPVYELLGITVAAVGESSTHDERVAAYASDVTYASISEAGFDFLRDQLIVDAADSVLPPMSTVIIDEADSILIDEARVPLVLAGSIGDTDDESIAAATATLVATLQPGRDFNVVDDRRNVQLTDRGAIVVERAFGGIDLYDEGSLHQLTAVNQALHARALLTRDVDYIVRNGKVALVDEFRGRVARRRRWPDGLQAAVEAKEGLVATDEGQVLGSITVQAFIGLYPTVCGMTGTALKIGDQLREFYGLEVAVIPSNRPCIRVDEPDRVYASAEEKEIALIAEVVEAHETGRPVLVGTLDVAESERLASRLRAQGIDCVVLNAKNDAEEAAIVAEAGGVGAVTVSTQMAGRGTDIRLGGSSEADRHAVVELGGLFIIGAGRHDSSRVDDQLRGRAGRQGDPGGSVFFVSSEDSLVVTNEEHVDGRADWDGRITGPNADQAVAHAQRVAEGVSFEIHRNTWRYGVLIERQRQLLAARRAELLTTDAAAELISKRSERYAEVADKIGDEATTRIARLIALYQLDDGWADHLAMLADIREGVHLRALGRQDPLDEFHRAAIPAFREFMAAAEDKTVATFDEAQIDSPDWTPNDVGLSRPSATWTYMVHDNPFGSEIERFFANAARALLGRT